MVVWNEIPAKFVESPASQIRLLSADEQRKLVHPINPNHFNVYRTNHLDTSGHLPMLQSIANSGPAVSEFEEQSISLPTVIALTLERLPENLQALQRQASQGTPATALGSVIENSLPAPSITQDIVAPYSPSDFTIVTKGLGLEEITSTLPNNIGAASFWLSQEPAVGEGPTPQPPTNQPIPAQPPGGLPERPAQSASAADPELGNLFLQPIAPPRSEPWLYLLGRVDYFRSDNVLADAFDPIEDSLVRSGLTLYFVPPLGPSTYLTASVNINFIRYFSLTSFDYNDLQLTTGIYQQLTPNMYGQLSWSNQQLFSMFSYGERFLEENSIRLDLGRSDRITDQLSFNTAYQLKVSFSNPNERSRITNYLNASLAYDILPELQAAIDYQLVISSFTQQSRDDTYNQLIGRISYQITPESRLNLMGGWSFGNSSNPAIRFNSSIFGISFDFNLPLL